MVSRHKLEQAFSPFFFCIKTTNYGDFVHLIGKDNQFLAASNTHDFCCGQLAALLDGRCS